MDKQMIEWLIHDLDSYAKSVCKYEYGLPTYNNNYEGMEDHLDNMVAIVERYLEKENETT